MIVYTFSYLIEESWKRQRCLRTHKTTYGNDRFECRRKECFQRECFRTEKQAQKRLDELNNELTNNYLKTNLMPYIWHTPIKKWVLKNKEDLIRFGNTNEGDWIKQPDMNNPIEILCKKHGSFWQTPNNHLGYNKEKTVYGCPKCENQGET